MKIWQTNQFEGKVIVRGRGSRVYDEDGKAYLDLLSGTWCNVLGYAHSKWSSVICEQVEKLTHVGYRFLTCEVEEALDELKTILPPDLNRVVFLNSGSEAVELALKIARAATGRKQIAVVEKSYYGATNYALSLSEAGRSMSFLPYSHGVIRLPAPHCRNCPMDQSWPCGFSCVESVQGGFQAAALIYEPILANSGVIVPPPGYGAQLKKWTEREGALLIAEEVTTGMGRTGKWFAFEHDGIVPDILVIGKAIGGGLPIAAVVTTEKVEEACRGKLRHVQSHQNDPFSGRVATIVIRILKEEGLAERVAALGNYFMDGLKSLQKDNPILQEVRGKGLLLGMELIQEKGAFGEQVQRRLFEEGFILDYQPHLATFRFFPPYIIKEEEIDGFLSAFRSVLRE